MISRKITILVPETIASALFFVNQAYDYYQ